MDKPKKLFSTMSAFMLYTMLYGMNGNTTLREPESQPTKEDIEKVFALIPENKKHYWYQRYSNLSGKDKFSYF